MQTPSDAKKASGRKWTSVRDVLFLTRFVYNCSVSRTHLWYEVIHLAAHHTFGTLLLGRLILWTLRPFLHDRSATFFLLNTRNSPSS